jgi:hypothetical protein
MKAFKTLRTRFTTGLLLFAAAALAPAQTQQYLISTVAGRGAALDPPARAAQLSIGWANGVTTDAARTSLTPGQPFPSRPLAVVNSPIDVTVNGKSAEVLAAVGYRRRRRLPGELSRASGYGNGNGGHPGERGVDSRGTGEHSGAMTISDLCYERRLVLERERRMVSSDS